MTRNVRALQSAVYSKERVSSLTDTRDTLRITPFIFLSLDSYLPKIRYDDIPT